MYTAKTIAMSPMSPRAGYFRLTTFCYKLITQLDLTLVKIRAFQINTASSNNRRIERTT